MNPQAAVVGTSHARRSTSDMHAYLRAFSPDCMCACAHASESEVSSSTPAACQSSQDTSKSTHIRGEDQIKVVNYMVKSSGIINEFVLLCQENKNYEHAFPAEGFMFKPSFFLGEQHRKTCLKYTPHFTCSLRQEEWDEGSVLYYLVLKAKIGNFLRVSSTNRKETVMNKEYLLKSSVFRDLMTCSPVIVNRHFGGIGRLHFQS